jgi:hypothetical protein
MISKNHPLDDLQEMNIFANHEKSRKNVLLVYPPQSNPFKDFFGSWIAMYHILWLEVAV